MLSHLVLKRNFSVLLIGWLVDFIFYVCGICGFEENDYFGRKNELDIIGNV